MTGMKKLPVSFYQRENVLQIAKELLGKLLVTRFPPAARSGNGEVTSGRIVEVEAYNGIIDKASHAYGGRRTARNEIMYADGGVAYVYLCYGIHHLFNVVTNSKEIPHAILIRALEPIKGMDLMLKRVGKKDPDSPERQSKGRKNNTLTQGPGNLSKAMGIVTKHSGYSLQSKDLFIADDGFSVDKKDIIDAARIGVEYAGKDALLPYRFFVKGNPFVSGQLK
jgi:DNA-3-methyladenine glycosylase